MLSQLQQFVSQQAAEVENQTTASPREMNSSAPMNGEWNWLAPEPSAFSTVGTLGSLSTVNEGLPGTYDQWLGPMTTPTVLHASGSMLYDDPAPLQSSDRQQGMSIMDVSQSFSLDLPQSQPSNLRHQPAFLLQHPPRSQQDLSQRDMSSTAFPQLSDLQRQRLEMQQHHHQQLMALQQNVQQQQRHQIALQDFQLSLRQKPTGSSNNSSSAASPDRPRFERSASAMAVLQQQQSQVQSRANALPHQVRLTRQPSPLRQLSPSSTQDPQGSSSMVLETSGTDDHLPIPGSGLSPSPNLDSDMNFGDGSGMPEGLGEFSMEGLQSEGTNDLAGSPWSQYFTADGTT